MATREKIMQAGQLKATRVGAWLCTLMAVVLASVLVPAAMAQGVNAFDTGTIDGSIADPTGAMVPNATVTIVDTGTGVQKIVRSDNSGNFIAPGLQFGIYTVSATTTGFGTANTKPLTLSVGATVHVKLGLSLVGAEASVTVTGTSATVDTSTPTAGTTLNTEQIRNLPINGRDVTDFLEIAPGSVGSTGIFQGSINGQENFFTGLDITLDGQNASRGDVNGFDETEGNEEARLTRASVDSIQEIDFANSGYSAEVGHSLGPQMNIVTKGGTNQFHGEVFDFFRNDALDAKDYFTNALTAPKQPLRLNQFGGNLGGPIAKGKLFFFVSYEGIRQRTTAINSLNETPSAYVRSQFVPSMQPVLAQLAPLPTDCTSIPAPASCAVPNTTDAITADGADLVYDPAALPTTLREDSGAIRMDYTFSGADSMYVRYSIDNSLTKQEFGLNQGQTSPLFLQTQYGTIHETHIFGPTLLNDVTVAVNRFYSDTNSDTPQPLVGFSGFFTNLGSLPGPSSFNQITPFSSFEVLDNVTKTAGKNAIRAGVQLRWNRNDEFLRAQQTYEFASFPNLEDNAPFVLSKNGFPGFVGIRDSNSDFYLQDNWSVSRRLVLDLGVRYDYNTVWRERNNQLQNFDYATQAFLPANQAPYTAPKGDIAPRLGLSYDPFGNGKTAIHAYYGLFYNPMHFGFNLVSNIPAYQSYSVNVFQVPITYPEPNPALPAGTANVYIFPRNPKDPISPNWLLGVQQEIARNTVLTLNYVGNQDHHMQAGVDFAALNLNPANYVTQARTLSAYANEYLESDELNSAYNALQAQLRHNVGSFNFEANYTWSHEIDDEVNVFGGFSDPYNPNLDRGAGDWDVRNNFTTSVVYTWSELKQHDALVRSALGGWQTSSIIQTRSGNPVDVSIESGFFGLPARPDYTGQPLVAAGGIKWPYQSYNVNAYQIEPTFNGNPGDPSTIGNVSRNTLRAATFFQWDFSAMKNFSLWEKARLQFRADIFNLLNHPNFGNPDGGICTAFTAATATTAATCTQNPNFGKVSGTIADVDSSQVGTGTARQEQFSLKVIF